MKGVEETKKMEEDMPGTAAVPTRARECLGSPGLGSPDLGGPGLGGPSLGGPVLGGPGLAMIYKEKGRRRRSTRRIYHWRRHRVLRQTRASIRLINLYLPIYLRLCLLHPKMKN